MLIGLICFTVVSIDTNVSAVSGKFGDANLNIVDMTFFQFDTFKKYSILIGHHTFLIGQSKKCRDKQFATSLTKETFSSVLSG